jgi:photosynthetic reaction center cytochrome c subunit
MALFSNPKLKFRPAGVRRGIDFLLGRIIKPMYNLVLCLRRAVSIAGFALAATVLAHAQGPNAAGKTAEQVYKNIQVLKGTPADQLNQSMHLIEGATGLDCTYCHIEGAFDKDDKKPKETARKMMQMVIDINKSTFGGQQMVTCYTCHRGSPEPLAVPLLPTKTPLTPEEEEIKIALPSVDEILAKYVEGLGGQQAIQKITSRIITGTQYIPSGPGGSVPVPATVERDQKAPNMLVNIYHTGAYTISDGFDGTKAWAQNPQGVVADAAAIDQGRAKRDADFYLPLNLKQQYPTMRVQGIERVNDRDAYVVMGIPQGERPERLYFDTQTGLLLRKQTTLPTQAGNSPYQVDYADYRDTGSGVKFPFLITMNPASERTVLFVTATIHVTGVKDNATIDNSKFAKPASKPAPAQ